MAQKSIAKSKKNLYTLYSKCTVAIELFKKNSSKKGMSNDTDRVLTSFCKPLLCHRWVDQSSDHVVFNPDFGDNCEFSFKKLFF